MVRWNIDARGERPRAQKKVGLRLLGRVTHEEHGERGALETQHERRDVDPWVAVRGEHRERRVADANPHPCGDGTTRDVRSGNVVMPRVGDGAGIQAHRLDREINLVPVEHTDETVGVIGVGVGEGDDVDPPAPGREARPELGEEPRRIRTAVDEQRSTVELDEEGVTLADVERPHA